MNFERLTWTSIGFVAFTLVFMSDAPAHQFVPVAAPTLGEELSCIGMSHRDPNFVMVGTYDGKIFRTLDGGATWQTLYVIIDRQTFLGHQRAEDQIADYLSPPPGKSGHLQSWVQGHGYTVSPVGWQALLGSKGIRSSAINWIEVDWNDENRIYVGTTDGLYRSTDKGASFIRIYAGITAGGKVVNTIGIDPQNPQHIILGTAEGLWTSKDYGASFENTMSYYMRNSYFREVWFDPQQPNIIHVAQAGSAMASPDGGENWITTHWDEYSARADVQSLSLGPGNLRLMATRDGVFASWQGGEMGTWRRRGYRFVGTVINKILATQDPNVWFALTDQAVWLTTDAGENWHKYFQTGGREAPRWISAFYGDVQNLWMITNRRIYRLGTPPALLAVDPKKKKPSSLLDIPSLYTFYLKVMKHNHVHYPDVQSYRERSFWAAFLPTLSVGCHYGNPIDAMTYKTMLNQYWPYSYYNWNQDRSITFEFFAFWDLERLIFDRRRLPHYGRVERTLSGLRQSLETRIQRMYLEYQDTARTLINHPPANELAYQYLEIRLQEITAYFDQISGGFWSRHLRGEP